MFRARLMLVSVVAVVSAFALLASSASAKIAFLWKVSGKSLTSASETRAFTTSADGKTLDFHGTVAGIGVLLLSNKVSVKNGLIIGGKPGTNSEIVVFENVTVDPPLAACTAETGGIANPTPGIVETNLLKSEIVEGQTSKEPLILFSPKVVGGSFVEIKFLNKGTETCPVAGAVGAVTGNILAQPLPALAETLNGDLDFEAPSNQFLLSSGGAVETAGLSFAGAAATLTGLLLNVLTTDEKYGAF
jgi:hypothetical protein